MGFAFAVVVKNIVKPFGEGVEIVFEKISEIEAKNPKLAKKLAENADQAFLAKKLATIDTHVPFVFTLDECDMANFTKEKFTNAFKNVRTQVAMS